MIEIDVAGISASVRGRPEIICNNSSYFVQFNLSDEWSECSDIKAKLIIHAGTEETTQYITLSSTGTIMLPALNGVYAVEIAATSEEAAAETAPVWIDCTESILSYSGTTAKPYDVYDNIMEFLDPREGRTRETILAGLIAHYEHPPAPSEDDYKAAVAARTRSIKLTGTLTLRDGTVIEIDGHNINAGTLRIISSTVSGDFLLPGGVPSAELTASLILDTDSTDLYFAEIALTEHIMTAPFIWYPVPLGKFTVCAVGNDSETGVPITAYDRMKKLDEIKLADIKKLLPPAIITGRGYSPNEIIALCARYGGLEYTGNVDTTDFINSQTHSAVYYASGVVGAFEWALLSGFENADSYGDNIAAAIDAVYHGQVTYAGDVYTKCDLPAEPEMFTAYRVHYNGSLYVISELSEAVQTLRDLLMHTVTTINSFAFIDREGKLRVKPLSGVPYTPPEIKREIMAGDTTQSTVARAEYRLYRLETTYEDSQSRTVRWSDTTMWADGVTAELPSCPMWSVLDEETKTIQQSLNALKHALDPITFYPMRLCMYDDPALSLGDWVTCKGISAPITSIDWRYGNTETIECCGADAAAGIIKSQAQKAAEATSAAASNQMREIYRTLMHTYNGMQSFTYLDIQHYTYAEIEQEPEE